MKEDKVRVPRGGGNSIPTQLPCCGLATQSDKTVHLPIPHQGSSSTPATVPYRTVQYSRVSILKVETRTASHHFASHRFAEPRQRLNFEIPNKKVAPARHYSARYTREGEKKHSTRPHPHDAARVSRARNMSFASNAPQAPSRPDLTFRWPVCPPADDDDGVVYSIPCTPPRSDGVTE